MTLRRIKQQVYHQIPPPCSLSFPNITIQKHFHWSNLPRRQENKTKTNKKTQNWREKFLKKKKKSCRELLENVQNVIIIIILFFFSICIDEFYHPEDWIYMCAGLCLGKSTQMHTQECLELIFVHIACGNENINKKIKIQQKKTKCWRKKKKKKKSSI